MRERGSSIVCHPECFLKEESNKLLIISHNNDNANNTVNQLLQFQALLLHG